MLPCNRLRLRPCRCCSFAAPASQRVGGPDRLVPDAWLPPGRVRPAGRPAIELPMLQPPRFGAPLRAVLRVPWPHARGRDRPPTGPRRVGQGRLLQRCSRRVRRAPCVTWRSDPLASRPTHHRTTAVLVSIADDRRLHRRPQSLRRKPLPLAPPLNGQRLRPLHGQSARRRPQRRQLRRPPPMPLHRPPKQILRIRILRGCVQPPPHPGLEPNASLPRRCAVWGSVHPGK